MRQYSAWGLAIVTALLVTHAAPVSRAETARGGATPVVADERDGAAFREFLDHQGRLFAVAHRVLADNVLICGDRLRHSFGLAAANRDAFGPAHRSAAETLLGAEGLLQVVHVADGGPAAMAGLSAGDVILAVNGRPAPRGAAAAQEWQKLVDYLFRHGGVMTLMVRGRDGTSRTVQMTPQVVCGYQVILEDDDSAAVHVRGDVIHMSRDVVRVIANDGILALLIEHELVHRLMDALVKPHMVANNVLGLLFDILSTQRPPEAVSLIGRP